MYILFYFSFIQIKGKVLIVLAFSYKLQQHWKKNDIKSFIIMYFNAMY